MNTLREIASWHVYKFWQCCIMHAKTNNHTTKHMFTTTTQNENVKACVKCGNQKQKQCRFAISTMQIEDDKPNNDGDQKRTDEKIMYKTNESCPLWTS